MAREFKHINYEQRMMIKSLMDENYSKQEIADKIGVCRSSLYREIERGNDGNGYNPEFSESRYLKNLQNKGPEKIIIKNRELRLFIADCINKGMSPKKIIEAISEDERFNKLSLSTGTIYNAINDGLIPGVKRENLRRKTVKMFSGGHIIIPDWIRSEYNLSDGDLLHVDLGENGVIIMERIDGL